MGRDPAHPWLFGIATWQAARFRTARALRVLLEAHGLVVHEVHGAVFHPLWGMPAKLLAGLAPWLGWRTTFGAAFVAVSVSKPL